MKCKHCDRGIYGIAHNEVIRDERYVWRHYDNHRRNCGWIGDGKYAEPMTEGLLRVKDTYDM